MPDGRLPSDGSLVFVHGTGVRLPGYQSSLEAAVAAATAAGITSDFVECAWGDPLGVEFTGRSLPDPPSDQQLADEEADFARWRWLIDDPLFELDKLTIRDAHASAPVPIPGLKPAWRKTWDGIAAYTPTDELALLLKRSGLEACWDAAWRSVVDASVASLAYERSAHEIPEASAALARAVVAQLHVTASMRGLAGPSRDTRRKLVERLLADWKQSTYGGGAFLWNMFARAATRVLREHRRRFSDMATLPIGDILLYQSHGAVVRDFIRKKVAGARPPVTVVAHSLGGIACVDLFALPDPPEVRALVTVGSQSPLLYEIGALSSLKPNEPLPNGFPPWLNVYDRNDFLSYVAHRLFSTATDVEVSSGQPFPEAHSAYFGNPEVWREIRSFVA